MLQDVELNQRLQERYKLLFTKVVVPVMVVTTLFLVLSHWQPGNDRVFSGMVVIAVVAGLNVWLSQLKAIPTPWGAISARSDTFDTLRWCVNFPFDVYIAWSLNAHEAAAVIAWLLLTFGALTEVHQPRNKLITVGAAFSSFCVLVLWLYPTDLRTEVYLIACYLGLVFILWKLERYVAAEMAAVFAERLQRERVEREAAGLQREAAIGHSTRAINHEMNTLIGVARLSAERIGERQVEEATAKDVARLEKALSYMERVSRLILDDLGSESVVKRRISLAELQDDLRLLLCNGVTHCQARLEFDFPANAVDYWFEERTGSTYLILHNLAKNAYEAVLAKFDGKPGGVIQVSAAVEGGRLVLAVYDNGVGMSAQQVEDIRRQVVVSGKIDGHGLGLQFVWRECVWNGFELAVESGEGEFCRFGVRIVLFK
ncbi:sensor histidine kinase [Thiothrix fructosivorans]|uniref:histidine kinase n=1 Tax=Thiothrix fructosivorans TaxID=111770 RepID=A0A8B0SMB9_9GAMM|nr:HAMP domain-containing sensor histidine kinase [Thiothrix fructosivorans]MBO0612233.1 HAMP domain-containing histidine kinase [Thiothrix fructosivorans]QTX12275.1 HAMP domain-containing histidine kinase [Thiothrix fructosivorans]